jgi:hypothetical protein
MTTSDQQTAIEPRRRRKRAAKSIRVAPLASFLVDFIKGRGSYATRVWSALFSPLVAGAALGWSIPRQFAAFGLAILIVAIYSLAIWIQRRFLG